MTIEDQISCVRREIALRERVYPKQVAKGHMRQDKADAEIRRMRAVLETLLIYTRVRELERDAEVLANFTDVMMKAPGLMPPVPVIKS